MGRSYLIEATRELGDMGLNGRTANISGEEQGFVGWGLRLFRRLRGDGAAAQRKQLRLVETLSLGGKRQLMLVTCGGERFLVGGGSESVETIVRLNAGASPDDVAKSLDESCR